MRKLMLAALALATPVLAEGRVLAMFDHLQHGRWELRDHAGQVVQNVCVASGRDLIQLRHPGQACASYVVKDADNEVEVQYTCKGRGYGRTYLRRESDRLVQINGQGIADGLPFEFSLEARRAGDCAAR